MGFQGSMNIAPAGETPEDLLAQALEANLGVRVERYELDMNNDEKLVEEAFWNSPVPDDIIPNPGPFLMFQELDMYAGAPDFQAVVHGKR